ncbi:hypothetical protein MPH_02962, partial [Macrophomina phaseolina MS6]
MTYSSDALRRKYEEECAKRTRPDGALVFLELQDYPDLDKDPFVDYESLRAKQLLKDNDEIKFLIIGAGHSGLLTAVRLVQAGFAPEDIVLVDKAGGFGGVWYWNRYPGLTCDIEGSVYLPLLEETGYMPKHRYSHGPEIREHANRIARTWKLRGQFTTRVYSQEWDEKDARWIVRMIEHRGPGRPERNLSVRAQFVFCSPGTFHTSRVPNTPGFEDFRRTHPVFHTARWDYSVTGGSEEHPELTKLSDKTVAIVGTGATSIQVVPQLAEWSQNLYVFQRTPSYVGPRTQKEMEPKTWAKIAYGPGWQKARQENFIKTTTGEPMDEDLIGDGWSSAVGFSGITGSSAKGKISPDNVAQHIDELYALDVPHTESIRRHIESEVHDKEKAERLKPWYGSWCKRPTFHNDYLPAFNRENVTLIDTDGKGIEKYTPDGIVAGGKEYKVDVLVLATGFNSAGTAVSIAARAGMSIIGKGRKSIDEKWKPSEFGSLHGVATNGFPNLFFYTTANAAVHSNMTACLDMCAIHSAHIIAEAMRRTGGSEKTVVEVTREAEEAWGAEIAKRAR